VLPETTEALTREVLKLGDVGIIKGFGMLPEANPSVKG
jgi:hypothetical protein